MEGVNKQMTSVEKQMTLVDRIKILCIQNGTNLSKLEKEAELGCGTISKWSGASPTCANIQKISEHFGVTIDFLVTGRE